MADSTPAPVFPPPVNPSDLGKGPEIMGVTWTLTSLATIVVGLRLYVRTRSPSRLGWDDWCMLIATLFQLIAQSLATRGFYWGMGKHDADLYFDPQLINILKYSWLQLPFGAMVSIFARFSITILLIRIFSLVTWLKVYLIVFTTLQTIGGMMVIITVFAQVSPVEGLWNPMLPARRWDPRIQLYTAYTAGALFAFSDLTYGTFPVFIVWKLNMPMRKKLGLAFILALSLVTAVAAVMKVVVAQRASDLTTDVQYHTVQAFPWTFAEQCLVIILGSVPVFAVRIMSFDLSFFRKLASRVSEWSRRSLGSTHGTDSEINTKHAKSSITSDDGSGDSSRHLTLGSNIGHKAITRTDEYSVEYVPR